jgi:hypothetical protein
LGITTSAKVQASASALSGEARPACLCVLLLLEGQRRLIAAVAVFDPVRSSCNQLVVGDRPAFEPVPHPHPHLGALVGDTETEIAGKLNVFPGPPNHTSITFGTQLPQPIDHRGADIPASTNIASGFSSSPFGQLRRPGSLHPRPATCSTAFERASLPTRLARTELSSP